MSAIFAGRRIQVIGAIGSGKSTTARSLAERLGLPFIELDAIWHQPNWVNKPIEEFRYDLLAALAEAADGWVVAGNYFSLAGTSVLSQADTVVWLRTPFHSTFPRLFWRTVRQSWAKEELWNGNRGSWRMAFLSRDSVLWEAISKAKDRHSQERAMLQQLHPQPRIIELASYGAISRFIASVT